MKKKLISLILIVLAVLLFAAALFLTAERVKDRRLIRQAETFLSAGEYEAARDIFLSLGDQTMADECTRRISERSYREACALAENKEYLRAMELFKALGDYADSETRRTEVQTALYAQAMECMMSGNFADALSLFTALEGHLDSGEMAKRCASRLSMGESAEKTIIDDANLYGTFPTGKLYIAGCGYVFIPNVPDANTDFLLFFPGGRDIEEPLEYLYNFIGASSENTIALFLYRNGLYDMEAKARTAVDTLEEAAAECGIPLKAPLVCGSSMGAYPALHSAAYYAAQSLTVPRVLCFDAGVDWKEDELLLNESECAVLSEAGTELWLLEQKDVGMNRSGIADMVLSGCRVTMILCENEGHNDILYNALDFGMIDLALGRRSKLNTDNYTFVRLTPEDAGLQ